MTFNAGSLTYSGDVTINLLGMEFGPFHYIKDSTDNVVLYRIADFISAFKIPSYVTMKIDGRWKIPGRRDCYATWSSIKAAMRGYSKNDYMEELLSRNSPEVENNGIKIQKNSRILNAFMGMKNDCIQQAIVDFVNCKKFYNEWGDKYGVPKISSRDLDEFSAADLCELMNSYGVDVRKHEEPREPQPLPIVVSEKDGSMNICINLKIKK